MKKLFTLILFCLVFISCSSSRPHTKAEKYWLTAMIAGQVADAATTQYGLHRGLKEANPLYGKDPNMGVVIGVKVVYVGLAYGLGQLIPDGRKAFYIIGCIPGWGAAGWNLYQIEKGK